MNPFLTDLIGEDIKIIKSSDARMIGISGKVLDETKNTLKILSNGEKIIQKNKTVILVRNQKVNLDEIKFRPEEKIKKIRRRVRL